MEVPLPEVIDRMTILKLKIERIGEPHLQKEMAEYEKALEEFKQREIEIKQEWFDDLLKFNKQVWDLEADIRKGKEGELSLEEIGRRALAIRDANARRISAKNKIIEETGIGFKDVKVNHASAID